MKFISKDNEHKEGLYPLFFFEKLYTKVNANTNNYIFKRNKKKQSKLINSIKIFHLLYIKRLIRKIRQQNFQWDNFSELIFSTTKVHSHMEYENLLYTLIIQNVLLRVLKIGWEKKNKMILSFLKKDLYNLLSLFWKKNPISVFQ
jgi:hypothetical protein